MAVGLGQRLIIIRSLLFVVNSYFEFFVSFFLRVFSFYKIRNKANHPLSVESGWCLLFFIVDVFYGDGFRRGVRRLLRLR